MIINVCKVGGDQYLQFLELWFQNFENNFWYVFLTLTITNTTRVTTIRMIIDCDYYDVM